MSMRVIFGLFFTLLLLGVTGNTHLLMAQSKVPKKAEKFYKKGYNYFIYDKHEDATKWLKKAIGKHPKYLNAYARLAEIYVKQSNIAAAEKTYLKMLDIDASEKNNFMVHYTLGQMAYERGDYARGVEMMQNCLAVKTPPSWIKKREKAELLAKNCQFGAKAVRNPVPFNPILLDETINSIHDEYLPMITADEASMVYTRRFNGDMGGNEDFYFSYKDDSSEWKIATPLKDPINTRNNEGAICISPDGKYLYFAAKDRKDTEGGFDIYYCLKTGEDWYGPLNLGRPISSSNWDSQPSISADGKSLYFCSRRKGGIGGIDLYVSHLDGKRWGEAINLGNKINTPFDEQSPFIHPDGKTLYFSSNGHIGMGDADLYVVRKNEKGEWGTPENLGYPINTHGNENGLVVTASGTQAYYSSLNVADTTGLDLYYFDLPKKAQPTYVTYVKGKVFDRSNYEKLEAHIELIDLKTGAVIIDTYSDKINGSFLVTLPVGKDYMYTVSKEGYLFYSENFALAKSDTNKPYLLDIPLEPIMLTSKNVISKVNRKPNEAKPKPKKESTWNVGQSVVLKNVFFDTGSAELQPVSFLELDKLVELLKSNPKLKIEIGGHTDSTGSDATNQTLSTNRAKAVYNYLVKKNIEKQKLSYKGYASSKPLESNDTEEGRAANRRTTFTVLDGLE